MSDRIDLKTISPALREALTAAGLEGATFRVGVTGEVSPQDVRDADFALTKVPAGLRVRLGALAGRSGQFELPRSFEDAPARKTQAQIEADADAQPIAMPKRADYGHDEIGYFRASARAFQLEQERQERQAQRARERRPAG